MDSIDNNNSEEPLPLKSVVLLLLGGWGIAPKSEANAISSAKIPTFLNLVKEYPVASLNPGHKTLNARYLTLGAGKEMNDESIEEEITLTKVIAEANLAQIKITETERLAALTHYFNGHSENKALGEEWISVSSDTDEGEKKLALMRITREAIKAIKNEKYRLIIVSLPTLDLTSMRGDFLAVKKIVETLDKSLKKIVAEAENKNRILIVTSANGNAERMLNLGTEMIDTEMTDNPVPFIIVGEEFKGLTIGLADPVDNDLSLLSPVGTLADVAPTVLKMLGLEKPEEMTGKSLI